MRCKIHMFGNYAVVRKNLHKTLWKDFFRLKYNTTIMLFSTAVSLSNVIMTGDKSKEKEEAMVVRFQTKSWIFCEHLKVLTVYKTLEILSNKTHDTKYIQISNQSRGCLFGKRFSISVVQKSNIDHQTVINLDYLKTILIITVYFPSTGCINKFYYTPWNNLKLMLQNAIPTSMKCTLMY